MNKGYKIKKIIAMDLKNSVSKLVVIIVVKY